MSANTPTPSTASSVARETTVLSIDTKLTQGGDTNKTKKRRRYGNRDISFRISAVTGELKRRLRRLVMQQTTAQLRINELRFYIDLTKREIAESYKEDAAYKRKKGVTAVDDDDNCVETIYDDIIACHFACDDDEVVVDN